MSEADEPADPRRGEAWFEALREEDRARLTAEWTRCLARDAELLDGARRTTRREIAVAAGLFGAFDLACPGGGWLALLTALAAGALFGWLVVRLDACRLACVALGTPLFLVQQWTVLGGLTALHMVLLLGVASALGLFGLRREERAYG